MEASAYWAQIDVPRSLWDPTEGRHRRHGERSFNDIYGAEIHWVGTGAVGDHDDTGSELRDFERFHERSKGWEDLFYNVAIDTEGVTWEGRDATIPSQSNLRRWLTVLVVLGVADNPSDADLDMIGRRVWDLWGAVDPGRSPESLRAHRDRAQTACPGPDIYHDIVQRLRNGELRYDDNTDEKDADGAMFDVQRDSEIPVTWGTWLVNGTSHVRWFSGDRPGVMDKPGGAWIIHEQAASGRIVVVNPQGSPYR